MLPADYIRCMKRISILIAGFGLAAVAAFACYDSSAKERVILIVGHDAGATLSVDLAIVKYVPIADADLLSPVFASNFNRLVVFPELGSESVLLGYVAPARGPPKSRRPDAALSVEGLLIPSIIEYKMRN